MGWNLARTNPRCCSPVYAVLSITQIRQVCERLVAKRLKGDKETHEDTSQLQFDTLLHGVNIS